MQNEIVTARSCYERALQIWTDLGRERDRGRVTSHLARTHWYLGHSGEASRLAHEAVALLESFSDSADHLEALCELCRIEMLASRHAEAIEAGSHALALAEQRQDERVMAEVLNNVGSARFGLGEHDRGQAMLERSLAIAVKNRLDNASQRAYVNLICQLVEN